MMLIIKQKIDLIKYCSCNDFFILRMSTALFIHVVTLLTWMELLSAEPGQTLSSNVKFLMRTFQKPCYQSILIESVCCSVTVSKSIREVKQQVYFSQINPNFYNNLRASFLNFSSIAKKKAIAARDREFIKSKQRSTSETIASTN